MSLEEGLQQPNPTSEWDYVADEYGVTYCLGRQTRGTTHEGVVSYVPSSQRDATKYDIDTGGYFRRFIYQGLPEERERLQAESNEELYRHIASLTQDRETDIYIDTVTTTQFDQKYQRVDTWLDLSNPGASMFQKSLAVAAEMLESAGVSIENVRLYGAASFGLLATTDKIVDDIDLVIDLSRIDEFHAAMERYAAPFRWSDIDPYNRLPHNRQLLKAKRWHTSQIRVNVPYPMSIDLKVGRDLDHASLWQNTSSGFIVPFRGEVTVTEDTEAFSTSPAVLGFDSSDNPVRVLMQGYQYIGCAVKDDTIKICGTSDDLGKTIYVGQSGGDFVYPDFTKVPMICD